MGKSNVLTVCRWRQVWHLLSEDVVRAPVMERGSVKVLAVVLWVCCLVGGSAHASMQEGGLDPAAVPDAASDSAGPLMNVNVSKSHKFSGEPYIAVSTDGSRVVAGWMNSPGLRKMEIQVATSSDGGATWGPPVTLPHIDPDYNSADVSVAFDRTGTVHLTYIDLTGTGEAYSVTGGVVLYTYSEDNGATWATPSTVRTAAPPEMAIDRPWVVVDRSGGPRDGWVYVTSMTYGLIDRARTRHVYVQHSPDRGKTWSAVDARVDDETFSTRGLPLPVSVPGVGPEGTLWVVYPSSSPPGCPGSMCLVAAVSSDGGRTFSRRTVAPWTSTWPAGWGSWHTMAVDPSRAGHAAVAWVGGSTDPTASDILLARTTDGGRTWSAPVRLNDDGSHGNGVGQDQPWMAYSPGGGLAVTWRDRRAAGPGTEVPFEMYFAYSPDGGETFLPNRRLSTAPSPFFKMPCCNSFLGLALADGVLHSAWGDFRLGLWQAFYGRATLP
jgi:hypothetical protein